MSADDPTRMLLTPAALRWAAESTGSGGRVVSSRRLTGGITSSVHALGVVFPRGRQRRVVLRRWDVHEHPDAAERVRREAGVLALLEPTDLPAPCVLASDPKGEHCGAPSLLMSWLPGRLHLSPKDPGDWVAQMALLLSRIHDQDPLLSPFEPWLDRDALEVPSWTQRPGLWSDAIRLVRQAPPSSEHRFIHRDFQQFNLLWRADRLSGVVDWVFASSGPPSVDVAHCRLNLTLLYSPARAARFREAYEAIAGRRIDPWWDLAGMLEYLPGWGASLQKQAGRRLRVDFAGMHERVEEVIATILTGL